MTNKVVVAVTMMTITERRAKKRDMRALLLYVGWGRQREEVDY